MASYKILMAASEAAPFARTGGLGDVLGALPKALARRGHLVKLFLPHYAKVEHNNLPLRPLEPAFEINIDGKQYPASFEGCHDRRHNYETILVNNEYFYDRPELYRDPGTGKDYTDNDERFIFFNLAVMEMIKAMDWQPDIIHVHDWQAGLIPVYLKTLYKDDRFFAGVKTVLTIHNMGYQGVFESKRFRKLGLSEDLFYSVTGPFEFYEKVNFLKASILYTDAVTTVSARYADEIQSSEEMGAGLQDVLKTRRNNLTGIVNGVDYHLWSPTKDKKIPFHYNRSNLTGKRENKAVLLNKAGLPLRHKVPLIGIISRLADQKGFDLIARSAENLFELNLQMIVLGTGELKYHDLLLELEKRYPDKLKVYLTFDDDLAHLIEAGADMFLMPSRYEPCGLNQMYSLRYGTVPIVREVGGLADTVVNYNPETRQGTGFVFKEYTPEALLETVKRAVELYTRKKIWTKIMKAGMVQDFSWDKSAARYADLYEDLVRK
ncbi:MAG: glycogen synthase GlgA [candidate division Zixibacteria bacterium]|nr:glycogen synthase GlgA [candidate division Zixibacteria bacterium]